MLKDKLQDYHLILASGSPRRHQFFKDLGLEFEIRLKPVDESYPDHLQGYEITDYLAQLKAAPFQEELSTGDILITSDTIVSLDGQALGKPTDPTQAGEMLRDLSGKRHEVITSVCFTTPVKQRTVNCSTLVQFASLTTQEIDHYINQYRPFDKAGAYGIQEWIGLIGIERIEGSYFNVVGLPTHLVYRTLKEFTE